MSDFLFHKVSDKEKEQIREQAKGIMDDFSKKLSAIDKVDKKMEEPLIERDEGERDEGKEECSEIDRERMFDNAPKADGDFILGEKKKW